MCMTIDFALRKAQTADSSHVLFVLILVFLDQHDLLDKRHHILRDLRLELLLFEDLRDTLARDLLDARDAVLIAQQDTDLRR